MSDRCRLSAEAVPLPTAVTNRQATALQEVEKQTAATTQATKPPATGTSLPPGEELATLLVDNAPLAMAMFDREMHYLIANQRWLSEFQLNREDILGRSHFEVFPKLHDSWRKIYQRCLQGYVERCEEDILEHQDGSRDWIRWELRPWRLADSAVGGLIITCEILTPIKQAEQALQADHDLAEALLQGASPVVVLDSSGHIVRHSRGALQFADSRSATGDNLQGMPFAAAFPPDEETGPDLTDKLTGLAQGQPDPQITAERLVSRSQMADGSAVEIHWALAFITDSQGAVTRLVLTGIAEPGDPQATDRSAAAAESPQESSGEHGARARTTLRGETSDPLKTLDNTDSCDTRDPQTEAILLTARHAPLGLLLLDPEATILYANDQVGRILGTPLLPGDDIEKWLRSGCPDEAYAREVISEWRTNIWRRQLTRVLTLSNSEHLLKEVEFRPSLLEDGSLLIAIVDVTETQRTQEALRASETRLRGLFDNTPVAIALVDPAGYIFDANSSLETLLGRSRLELRRTQFDTLIAENDLDKKHEINEKMRREGLDSANLELGLRHNSGEIIPTRLHMARNPSKADRLAFTSLLIVNRDREDTLAAKLLESQLQNRALLLASEKAVFLIERKSRTVLDMHLPEHFPASQELRGLEGSRLAVTHPEIDKLLARLLLDTPEQGDWQRCGHLVLENTRNTKGAAVALDLQVTPVDAQRSLMLLSQAAPANSAGTATSG